MDPVGYTSCCVGILIMAEYDPHINPVDTANNPGFVHGSNGRKQAKNIKQQVSAILA